MSEQDKKSEASAKKSDEPAQSPKVEKKAESEKKTIIDDLIGTDTDQLDLHKKLGLIKDVNNKNNLQAHIKKVFSILIDSYPSEALEKLEEVSSMVKKDGDV